MVIHMLNMFQLLCEHSYRLQLLCKLNVMEELDGVHKGWQFVLLLIETRSALYVT